MAIKTITLFLFIFLYRENSIAQNLETLSNDALYHLLDQAKDGDSAEIAPLNVLAFNLVKHHPSQADSMAKQALKLAMTFQKPVEAANSYVVLGLLAKESNQAEMAEDHIFKAVAIRMGLGDLEGVASCYNNLGNLWKDKHSNHAKAKDSYLKGLDIIKGLPNAKIAAVLHNNLGAVLTRMGEYDQAFLHLDKGLELRKERKDKKGIAFSLLNLGMLFQEKGEPYRSEAYLRESLKLFEEFKSTNGVAKCQLLLGNLAFYSRYYPQALALYEEASSHETSLDSNDQALLLRNQASCFVQLGEQEKALELYRQARSIFHNMRRVQEQAAIDFDLGNVYFELAQFSEAERCYRLALDRLKTIDDNKLKAEIANNLHWTLRRLGRYEEALFYFDDYQSFTDSLQIRAAAALSLERDLAQMRKESMEARNKNLMALGITGFLTLGLFLSLAILIAFVQGQKRKMTLQQIDEMIYRHELEIGKSRLEAEENERERIGKDLHERIGGMLTAVKLYLELLNDKIDRMPQENRQRFDQAMRLLDETYEEVRGISHNLESGILKKFGLKTELEAFADMLGRSGRVEVELTTYGLQERLNNRHLEKHISSIIRELAVNVIKHARATKLSIQTNRFENELNIMIEDNGTGFDVQEAEKKGGKGLANITTRVYSLQGTIQIDSIRGKGTSVTVEIPLN